jgi:hypothetical protein
VPDGADNAYLTPNPDQRDSDGDGFGDAMDADFNNDGRIDEHDLSLLVDGFRLKSGDSKFDPQLDLDGDDEIGFPDYQRFIQRWGQKEPVF